MVIHKVKVINKVIDITKKIVNWLIDDEFINFKHEANIVQVQVVTIIRQGVIIIMDVIKQLVTIVRNVIKHEIVIVNDVIKLRLIIIKDKHDQQGIISKSMEHIVKVNFMINKDNHDVIIT
jgi:hypothetical protein